jgi:predicted ATPase
MLTQLELSQFKNFREATLMLGPLTVLVGTNASGKSNLRDALRFVHGIGRGYTLAEIIGEKWGEGGVQQWRGIRGGPREAVFAGRKAFKLSVVFRSPNEKYSGRYEIKVSIENEGEVPRVVQEKLIFDGQMMFDSQPEGDPLSQLEREPEHLPVRLQRGGAQRKLGHRFNGLDTKPILTQLPDNPKVSPASVKEAARITIQEFEAMRFLDLEPEALRRPSFPGQRVLGDKGENLSSVLQVICAKPELKQALLSWMEELTPMDAVDFTFPDDQAGRILVSLVEKNGQAVSAYSASDGTLRFLAMIAALLGPESARFYFFEELDNGIHPARLHLLLSLIERQTTSGKVQIVATTHSPELLELLDKASLEYASLIYRLPQTNEGCIQQILEIPGFEALLAQGEVAKLHATGWLEDAVYFCNEDTGR